MGYLIVFFLLGGIAGFLFSLDVCYKPKEKGSFVKILTIVFASLIPLITGVFFKNNLVKITTDNMLYFYLGFVFMILLTAFYLYFTLFLPLIKKMDGFYEAKRFTILDFFKGYHVFKKEYDEEWNRVIQTQKNDKDLIKPELVKIRANLLKFIDEINSNDYFKLDIEAYLSLVLSRFILNFFGGYNARVTIREYDEENNSMVTKLTTRTDAIPGAIPLDKPNLISKSAQEGKPLIYSENSEFHFDTNNKSIKKGVYKDYVTYCLLEFDNDTPAYSISLDVKDKSSIVKMKTLVHSLGFDILCWTIIKRFMNEKI